MPKRLFSRQRILVLLAALLLSLSLMNTGWYLAWPGYILFFVATWQQRGKEAFRSGALLGSGIGILALHWMPAVLGNYTGGSISYGILGYIGGVLVLSLYFGLLMLATAMLRSKTACLADALPVAALWIMAEWLFEHIFTGMPWLVFRAGNLLLDNLYAIQPAAWGGVYLTGFCLIAVSYVAAWCIAQKKWPLLALPAGLALAYHGAGYLLLRHFETNAPEEKVVRIALLCENTPADLKWDQQNGAALAGRLLQLSGHALPQRPDIALWTESAVPWTYSPNDDFIQAVLQRTAGTGITHILGMNTEYDSLTVYNSAYCLLPDGRVSGRYDKRFLLSLAEQPLSFFSLPFLHTDGFAAQAGNKGRALPTPHGKAGVLICNEATVPGAAIAPVRDGATFLVNMSNDGWFGGTPYLVNQHFYNARLRAVEVRRDMAINSNLGISGLVTASGIIKGAISGAEPMVGTVPAGTHSGLTWYTRYPYFFLYVFTILIVFSGIIRLWQP